MTVSTDVVVIILTYNEAVNLPQALELICGKYLLEMGERGRVWMRRASTWRAMAQCVMGIQEILLGVSTPLTNNLL